MGLVIGKTVMSALFRPSQMRRFGITGRARVACKRLSTVQTFFRRRYRKQTVAPVHAIDLIRSLLASQRDDRIALLVAAEKWRFPYFR